MADANVAKGETVNGDTGGMLFELPDASSYDGESGSNIVQYEKMRNFGSQCRAFFSRQVLWEAAGSILRVINRVVLRFKAAGTNVERENDVFCSYAVGCKMGAVRTIRIESAQVFPEMISYRLTPPVQITASGMLAGYRAYCTESSTLQLGPNMPPRTHNSGKQLSVLNAAMSATGVNIDLDVAHSALWTRIWLNFQSIALCFTGQVEAQWSGSLANVNYCGRIGSGAADCCEHSAELSSGTVIYVEDDLETLMDTAPLLGM